MHASKDSDNGEGSTTVAQNLSQKNLNLNRFARECIPTRISSRQGDAPRPIYSRIAKGMHPDHPGYLIADVDGVVRSNIGDVLQAIKPPDGVVLHLCLVSCAEGSSHLEFCQAA